MQRTSTPGERPRSFPIADLDGPMADLVRQLHAQDGPITLTHDGLPLAVLVSPEIFEALQTAVERWRLQRAVDAAEIEIQRGQCVAHEDVVSELDRWIAGED